MIRDLLQTQPDLGLSADICIIGAGAAGIILAIELVRLGRRVFLLEGGGAQIEDESQEPYRSELAGLHHKGIHTGRFRAEGGTTRRWGGQILELTTEDFEARSGVPGSGWPFHKNALLQYYERALDLEGLSKVERSDEAVWKQIGSNPPAFDSLEMYFSRWCPEPDFAHLHRQVLEANNSLTVWLHANAVEPVFEGETMCGMRCKTQTGIETVFRAQEFVFCLGAIESSRFFLQPELAQYAWNQYGLLGKHFQDHIDCNVAIVEPIDRGRFHAVFDNVFIRGFKYHPKLRLSPVEQARIETLNIACTMNFPTDSDDSLTRLKAAAKNVLRGHLADLEIGDLGLAFRNTPLLLKQAWRYGVKHRIYNPPDGQIMLRVHCEQEPLSNSSITLAESRDSLGMLRTRLNWQISEKEIDTIRKFASIAQKSLSSLARLTADPDLMTGNPSFIAKCDDSNHHMGGMRMGSSAADGIVDPDLLLYGTSNVYICSSAVFPTSGFSNPTHTLLALAVRLAEHLS
jgi:choline dehydrogenase-like flavoprotein